MSLASLITIFFSISLPALAAAANSACPIDLSYVETIPWDKSLCQNNHSDCCQTVLSLFGIGLARHLKSTLMFQLPNQVAASACRIDLQTRLQSLSLQPSLVPTCFNDSNQFITSASKCAGIVTVQDWEQKLGLTTTELDESCRRGLSDTTACHTCLVAGMKVTSQLVSLGRNASNNCFYFTVLYAAGIVNELGPENVETASCILGLPLTTRPFSLGLLGSPWLRYALRFRSVLTSFAFPNLAPLSSVLICFGSLYFWAAHLASPKWAPLASWCCAWLETIGVIAGIGAQAYSGAQMMQVIILICTGTNKGGGYLAPRWLFLCMYIAFTIIWAVLNTFALQVVAFLDIISVWWQVVGGSVIIIMLPMVAKTTQSASYVFTHCEINQVSTGVHSKAYAVILSVLYSQFSLYGYDTAAHLTEETKGADKNGPIAILSTIGLASLFGWGYLLALTFSIRDPIYLYDVNNETAGSLVPAQIIYDAFQGRFHNSTGAIIFLFIIWGSFFFCGLSITTGAARVVYALSRDNGIPYSSIWKKVHPKYKVPMNAVWLCAAISILLGLPILKLNVIFTAITSISTVGWVGGYAVPIFARMVMDEKNFKPGPFYLGKASRPICLVAFLWICYTCSAFLLPTLYPIKWNNFNYAPVALGIALSLIMIWWVSDARKWFKGPVRNINTENGDG